MSYFGIESASDSRVGTIHHDALKDVNSFPINYNSSPFPSVRSSCDRITRLPIYLGSTQTGCQICTDRSSLLVPVMDSAHYVETE
ncbi:hypothetical protein T265_03571 [Opisthorchis viverrini]|uniref:Uncharacterized protein n=1 Tax=Opisthorchis viverrini TaxID=6198 RepID=A0A075AHH1_OPIVI|nr:hypothetical protein T265_03571 [Opisthorchis viverrini]KER29874.1 hypothetical protein T265_03571 [Opisthorchis viverrini]